MSFSLFQRFPMRRMTSSILVSLLSLSALSGLLAVPLKTGEAATFITQCSDGVDNDNNGKTDFPDDPNCSSADDNSEFAFGQGGVDVSLTDNREKVAPGRSLTYSVSLRLSPTYPNNSKIVNVDLFIPNDVTLRSASTSGFQTAGRIHWDSVTVSRGDTVVLTANADVSAQAAEGRVLLSHVVVEDKDITDATTVSRSAIEPGNQFRGELTDDKQYAMPGETLNYTLTVRNVSTLTSATEVRVIRSPQTTLIAASGDPETDRDTIDWGTVVLAPNEQRVFTFRLQTEQRLPENYTIRARALIGAMELSDNTVMRKGLAGHALSAYLTDGRDTVERDETLTYTVHIANTSDAPATHVFVSASLPTYGTFQSADQGGVWDGTNMRWTNLQIASHAVRDVHFTVRVRPDAVFGSLMETSVSVDGGMARDYTEVVRLNSEGPSHPRHTGRTTDPLIVKTADRNEVFAGGLVHYSITVNNVMDHAMRNTVVDDTFDARYFSLQSYDPRATVSMAGNGHMRWTVPTLEPGKSWTVTYTLSLSADAPAGLRTSSIARLVGDDVVQWSNASDDTASTESANTRLYAVQETGVFNGMPTTGAGDDLISLSAVLLGLLPLGAATIHRRKLYRM